MITQLGCEIPQGRIVSSEGQLDQDFFCHVRVKENQSIQNTKKRNCFHFASFYNQKEFVISEWYEKPLQFLAFGSVGCLLEHVFLIGIPYLIV